MTANQQTLLNGALGLLKQTQFKNLLTQSANSFLSQNPTVSDQDFANFLTVSLQSILPLDDLHIDVLGALKNFTVFIAGVIAVKKTVDALSNPPVSGPMTGLTGVSLPPSPQTNALPISTYTGAIQQTPPTTPTSTSSLIGLVVAGGAVVASS